ncbi:MAG: hypothetical protein N3F07_01895, partial [Candidatus Micrarchaeota archaeon]|nr:hypothetical protein [Candidatus Micrarchaeota archaeon]
VNDPITHCNSTSRKTRIETCRSGKFPFALFPIATQHPEKQGLEIAMGMVGGLAIGKKGKAGIGHINIGAKNMAEKGGKMVG